TWGMYYVGAIGAYSATKTDDIYEKTFRVRFPFALSALLGLVIFCLSCRRFFQNTSSYKYFIALFIILELFSISLIYHMREARYYSLVILGVSFLFYLYINHFFFEK